MSEFLAYAGTLNWHGFALFLLPIIGTWFTFYGLDVLEDDVPKPFFIGILAYANLMLWHSVYMVVRLVF